VINFTTINYDADLIVLHVITILTHYKTLGMTKLIINVITTIMQYLHYKWNWTQYH